MPSLPVFASPSVNAGTTSGARDLDPDSKRFRFKPNSVRRGTCCGNIAIRWLALGFILGMLIFATLSVLQGDSGPVGLLSATRKTRPVGSAATQDDEVIMLDGKDGQFRDAAPGWQPSEQQQEKAAAAQRQSAQPQQQEQQQQDQQQQQEQQAAAQQQSAQPQQQQQQQQQQQVQAGATQQQSAQPQQQQLQLQEQAGATQQQQLQEQRLQQQQQPAEQADQRPEVQASEQLEQQPQPATAMALLHSLGIRYHEREPGTPAEGGYYFLPPGNWADRSARRILIYLGANVGAEMDYVIKYDRERQKEYDLAIAFEARPDHNGFWQTAAQERSNPAVQYINTAVWWRNVVLDLGNRDLVGSVLRTKQNDFGDASRTMQVQGIDFAAWVDANIRDDDEVTLVSDIQGAEFPVFAHLADSGLAGRIDTLYLECHYLAHSNLIDAVSESSCRQLCLAVTPHVKHFYFWVGPNQTGQIVRGFDFVNKPGLQPGDCNALHSVAASETTQQ